MSRDAMIIEIGRSPVPMFGRGKTYGGVKPRYGEAHRAAIWFRLHFACSTPR